MIEITCECGRELQFDDDFAGRQIQCSQCGRPLQLPEDVEVFDFDDDEMQDRLDWLQEKTQSQASNPGMLRVSYLRYALAFPKWVFIWHALLLGSIALVLVHWSFVFLVAFFAFCVWLYWRRVKFRFIGGCVNPAQVISLSPPLIAVYTDLSKGLGEWQVIKVLPQPLSKMAGGMPKIGQQMATISVYQSLNDELDHWDNFYPIIVDVATGDVGEIERIQESVDSEDWDELKQGMQQISQPYVPGIYRVYSPEQLKPPATSDGEEIANVVAQTLGPHSKDYCHTAAIGLPAETLQKARQYLGKVPAESILAILESFQVSKDAETGMALTPRGVFYNYPEIGSGAFAWKELAGAFFSEDMLELTLCSGQRLRISTSHFRTTAYAAIEETLNTAIMA